MQGPALGQQEIPVQLLVAVAVHLERDDPLPIQARQVQMLGVPQDLRQEQARGMAQHPEAVVQVPVQFHEADGDEAVEPGVGRRLHGLLEAVLLDPRGELLTLGTDRPRVGLPLDQDQLPLLPHGRGALGGEAEGARAAGDGGDEVAPGLGGVGLDLIGVHGEEVDSD